MTATWTRSLLLRGLRGLALLAAMVAGPSHAALYTGVWDPAYGAPFTNLGWRGNATFFVPDGCIPTAPGTVGVPNSPDCGGLAAVTSAQVEFYDASPTSPTGQTTLATITFNPASLLVNSLQFIDGALVELDTSASNQVAPDADLSAFGVTAFNRFFLQFDLQLGPRLGYVTCSAVANFCTPGGFNDAAQFPVDFKITRLPEPGTLALAGLALAGLMARRRDRKA